jgi:hypothetical protein
VTFTARRLPGISFVVQPPPPAAVLPRMDVAVFVGFTASGPLQTPVVVEDPTHFASLFGDDAPLAWDPEQGATTYAHLAPAVRAFFRNGGQRCWVVRVAGAARDNFFPIPGLARLRRDGSVVPTFARARSEGSWSDGLRVGASLSAEPISGGTVLPQQVIEFRAPARTDLAPGDLLRVTYDAPGYVQLFAVQSVWTAPQAVKAGEVAVRVSGGPALWLRAAGSLPSPLASGTLQTFRHDGQGASFSVDGPPPPAGQVVILNVHCAMADAPAPGSLVRADFGGEPFWLLVQDVRAAADGGSPLAQRTQLSGPGFWQMTGPPSPAPAAASAVERLTFDLWVRQGDGYPVRGTGLGCAASHPSYWGALPDDVTLYGDDPSAADPDYAELRQAAADPRFPLAGGVARDDTFSFPLGMALFADNFLGPDSLPGTALERDGLAHFGAGLFLGADDPTALRALLDANVNNLLSEANFLRYQAPPPDTRLTPRPLHGIYAALELDEATLIVVPDAVHRGWSRGDQDAPLPPQDSQRSPTPAAPGFAPCPPAPIPPPTLTLADGPTTSGTFSLEWTTLPGASYVVEEAIQPNFSDAVPLYAGKDNHLNFYARRPGDYYYHVSATVGGVMSDWSKGIVVRVAPPGGWQVAGTANYSPDALLIVQRALLRLCAARGDLLPVLALPGHYREDDALAHVARLTTTGERPLDLTLSPTEKITSQPLGFGESAALSYGAVYYPWLIGSPATDPEGVRPLPPDGAACGVLAQRALTRGAWIAPANEALSGVVDLAPLVAPERLLDLFAAQINVFRQEARGFVAQGADTLASDADGDVRPINVRRLLSLLRRLALQQGPTYVFEPNDDALRRRVRQDFGTLMQSLFVRGAFAGPTPDTSFQVVTDTSVNTPATRERGQFIVELRVAPSLPLTFLTVRLVQSGDRAVVTEVR